VSSGTVRCYVTPHRERKTEADDASTWYILSKILANFGGLEQRHVDALLGGALCRLDRPIGVPQGLIAGVPFASEEGR